MEMKNRKFTIKAKGGKTFVVHAKDEGAAISLLVKQNQVPYNQLSFVTAGEDEPEFIIQVGARDYTCVAPDAVAALTAFAKMGLNMNKARNLRRR